MTVASVAECRAALDRLAAALAENAAEMRQKANLDRSVACHLTDLRVTFRGRLHHGELRDVVQGDDPKARIRLSATSDDLIAMIDGELDFARALATRRVAVRANPLDLVRLHKLL
jgi:putative sterol carrier protein